LKGTYWEQTKNEKNDPTTKEAAAAWQAAATETKTKKTLVDEATTWGGVCVCATDTDAAYKWWTLWRGREQVSATYYCNCCKTARFWHNKLAVFCRFSNPESLYNSDNNCGI
jgi:hypothetical protein